MNDKYFKNRESDNKRAYELLGKLIEKYPEQRIGQIIANYMFPDYRGKDFFYEEPFDTVERLKKALNIEDEEEPVKERNISIEPFCSGYSNRYCVVDTDTGEIIDDAQGYGYKTEEKAMAAYKWKNMDRNAKKQYFSKLEDIKKFMDENPKLKRKIELHKQSCMLYYEPMDKEDIENIFKTNGFSFKDLSFNANDISKYWKHIK